MMLEEEADGWAEKMRWPILQSFWLPRQINVVKNEVQTQVCVSYQHAQEEAAAVYRMLRFLSTANWDTMTETPGLQLSVLFFW